MERDFTYYLHRFFTEAFPEERPEVRQKRILDLIKSDLPIPMTSAAEQRLKVTIGNPALLLTNDIRVHRDHVQQNGHSFDRPDLPKCSARAAKLRSDGNVLYVKKDYEKALRKYNESICSAPNDSEALGIGYANRSAVYYTVQKHSLALADIKLAKKFNYPERLMAKLLVREANCKQPIDKDYLKANSTVPPALDLNPFVSDGVCVRKLHTYNNSMVAGRAFKAGDVILREKPLMVAIDEPQIFAKCNHCRSGNLLHLIPCPNCVSTMFCNEKCLLDGQPMHRFECGITGDLSKLSDAWIGSRLFFHGLALFDNDISKMMQFCQTVKGTGNFLDMDYSNYDALKEFKIFLAVKPTDGVWLDKAILQYAAIVHVMLLTVDSVRAFITNREQEDFMLQCSAEYSRKAITMSIQRAPTSGIVSALYPVASLCNHSCDPNALALDYGGQLKLIALRPIHRGEQICVSYGAHYEQDASQRQFGLAALGFNCICEVCDVQTHQQCLAKARQGKNIAPEDWADIIKLLQDTVGDCITNSKLTTDIAGEFTAMNNLMSHNGVRTKALQQFIQRYASIHPRADFASILKVYRVHLEFVHCAEMNAAMQARIAG